MVALAALAVGACAGRVGVDGAPPSRAAVPPALPGDPTPRPEARSRYGNGPIYEVYGQRYRVLPSSYGYEARGVASWYGKKFHGRPTASRERYDMYAMTAAHKSLPLPTYVEVRNLRNDKRVIVRVNDRGPFVHNRLIDLSYAAALKLDMVRDGTSLVEVKAISFDEPPPEAPSAAAAAPTVAATESPRPGGTGVYVQVGAFGDEQNAERRYRLLQQNGFQDAFVVEERAGSPPLYRVRIGPIADVDQYDRVVAALSRIGIREKHIVTD